jgi:hypothetical protein
MKRLAPLVLALVVACSDATTDPQQPTEPSVLQLSPGDATLEQGSSYPLRIWYTRPDGTPLPGRAVLTSDNVFIATAETQSDTLAVITAHGPGIAHIAAHMGDETSNTVTITVYPRP